MCKRILAALTAAVLALSLSACSQQEGSSSDVSQNSPASTASQQPALPTEDRAGNAITVPETVNTIVSLAPSVTQVLCELGLADKIVGIDNQSPNYTDQLKDDLPQFDMMSVDTETLIALKPDIVFASGISYVGAEDPFKSVRDVGICVADIPSSSSLNDVKLDNQFIADCVGKSEEGKKLNDDMQATIDKVAAIGKTITDKQRVMFSIADFSALYSFGSGTFLNEMIELIGAVNVFADQESWISVTTESAVAANPDVILTNVNYIPDPIADFTENAAFAEVNAVKNDRVYLIDNAASSLPNHHVVDALVQMALAVYPDQYAEFAE